MDNLVYDTQNIEEKEPQIEKLVNYECNDCHCNFSLLSENHDKCVYCGSNNITTTNNYNLDFSRIIPFTLDIENAKNEYKKHVLFNPLIPIKFKKKSTINKIQKVYFMTYLFNVNYRGNITFLGADKEKVIVDKKKLVETKKYNMLSEVNFDYSNVLINPNEKITMPEFTKVFQYDYNKTEELREFDIKDTVIINSTLSNDEILEKAKERISKSSLSIIRNNINHQLNKVEDNQTNVNFESAQKILLPIYFINTRYRNKNYHFLYNGVNKNTYYKFPVGIIETIIFALIVFGIVLLIGYLIASAL